MTDTRSVLTALDAVRDPELDEPVTSLGFVSSCTVSEDGVVEVRLRLPTYFCAPNFAFLMVADAYEAVRGVVGVTETKVVLEDHFASDQINAGVAARSGFVSSFDGEAEAELDGLRVDFLRKALLAATDQACRPLVAAGLSPEQLVSTTLGELHPAKAERLQRKRRELGLPAEDSDALIVDPVTGEGIGVEALPLHLRRARLTGVSLEANGSICRGMLRERYATAGAGEEERR